MTSISGDDMLFEDDDLIFDDDESDNHFEEVTAWKILIVDDDPQVHEVTKLALARLIFQEKSVQFFSAYNTAEAISLLDTHSDFAVILLDVVMEEKDSGLHVAKYIRKDLENNMVRIVLRTGQPGEVPEEAVILNFAINDYKTKSELTRQKLFATIVSALRSYCDLLRISELYEALQLNYRELQSAKERVDRADRAKNDFLRIINHELRTPLNVIIGMAEMLTEGVYGPLNDQQHHAILDLGQSSHHFSAIINDILDFANLQSDVFRVRMAPCEVPDICHQSIRVVKQLAHRKDIEMSLDMTYTGLVEADPLRLRQILVNLLDNAVKFTPANGKVSLRVSPHQADMIAFTVGDTGIGIALDFQEQIFEPFFQIENSLTQLTDGTGLGLSLVRRMVELQGGHISVKSEPGQGSRFTIFLKRSSSPTR